MEENKTLIGALIFIVMVVGANFVMYAIVRGATRPGGGGFLETIAKSLNTNQNKKKDDMAELRRTLQELNEGKNKQGGDSE
jgi:hypothetical protein